MAAFDDIFKPNGTQASNLFASLESVLATQPKAAKRTAKQHQKAAAQAANGPSSDSTPKYGQSKAAEPASASRSARTRKKQQISVETAAPASAQAAAAEAQQHAAGKRQQSSEKLARKGRQSHGSAEKRLPAADVAAADQQTATGLSAAAAKAARAAKALAEAAARPQKRSKAADGQAGEATDGKGDSAGSRKKRKAATPADQQPAAGDQQGQLDRLAYSEAAAERPVDTTANGVEETKDHALDDKLDRTIFVGNLRANIKPKAVKKLFARYGAVQSVRLRSVPVKLDVAMPRRAAVLTGKVDADRATAHAYVVFSSPEEAQAALAHNMQVVDDLHVRVDLATDAGGTAAAKSYSRARSIFVGNLSFTQQDEELVRLFSDGALDPELENAVTAVRVVRDSKTNIGKGIAFVEFKTKGAASAAMRLDGHKLGSRPLRISFLKTPKPGATEEASNKPSTKAGGAGQKVAAAVRARIDKRKQHKSTAQPWMGTKTKGPLKSSSTAKGKMVPPAKAKQAIKPKTKPMKTRAKPTKPKPKRK